MRQSAVLEAPVNFVSAQEITDNLAALKSESKALEANARDVQQSLDDLRPDLLAGTKNAVQTAAGYRARLDAINDRRAELAAEIEREEERLPWVMKAEEEWRDFARMTELATASQEAFEKLEQGRRRLNDLLLQAIPELAALRSTLFENRREFIELVRAVAPAVYLMNNPSISQEAYEQGQVDLQALLQRFEIMEATGPNMGALLYDWGNWFSMQVDRPLERATVEPYGPQIDRMINPVPQHCQQYTGSPHVAGNGLAAEKVNPLQQQVSNPLRKTRE